MCLILSTRGFLITQACHLFSNQKGIQNVLFTTLTGINKSIYL